MGLKGTKQLYLYCYLEKLDKRGKTFLENLLS